MGASFEINGLKELQATLSKLADEQTQKAAGALYRIAEQIMREAKEQTPVRDGILRASGTVSLPDVGPDGVTVTMGFGGAAEAYAVEQHENLQYRHTVGNAKFLERPTLEHAKTLEDDLAREMQR